MEMASAAVVNPAGQFPKKTDTLLLNREPGLVKRALAEIFRVVTFLRVAGLIQYQPNLCLPRSEERANSPILLGGRKRRHEEVRVQSMQLLLECAHEVRFRCRTRERFLDVVHFDRECNGLIDELHECEPSWEPVQYLHELLELILYRSL